MDLDRFTSADVQEVLEQASTAELQYLLRLCRALSRLGFHTCDEGPGDSASFDADELGLDPEVG